MPWIENRSKSAVLQGQHRLPSDNTMLIRISDPCGYISTPHYKFAESYTFEFLDAEDGDTSVDDGFKVSDQQAGELVQLLQRALDNNMDVIVHCHMGLCRSGAVVDVAVEMGFEDPKLFRAPNMRVKSKMRKYLGWTYENTN